MATPIHAEPEWCLRIRRLVGDLNITQAALAERLGVSPATVSRWIQGKIEPTAEGYVALGNLAPRAEGAFFFERAGLDISTFREPGGRRAVSSLQTRLSELKPLAGRKAGLARGSDANAAVIPLLKIEVSALDAQQTPITLADSEVEDLIIVPIAWCTNPEHTVGIRLADDSMAPLIAPGSILFLDTAEVDRELARNHIVVTVHRDLGYRAARLQRFGGADLLIAANTRYPPLDVSNAAKWRVCGRVLWWISRPEAMPG